MPKPPAGYTLVEVIVALFVFSVGALALAATSAVIAREMTTNSLRERSALAASNRLEILRSRCVATSGEETRRGVTSAWSAATASANGLSVEATTTRSSASGGEKTDTYRATIGCTR